MKFREKFTTIFSNDKNRIWHLIVDESNKKIFDFILEEIKFYRVPVRSLIIQSFQTPNDPKFKWIDILKTSQGIFHENLHFKDFYFYCNHSAFLNEISLQKIFENLGPTASQLENFGFHLPMRTFPPNFPKKFFKNTVKKSIVT